MSKEAVAIDKECATEILYNILVKNGMDTVKKADLAVFVEAMANASMYASADLVGRALFKDT